VVAELRRSNRIGSLRQVLNMRIQSGTPSKSVDDSSEVVARRAYASPRLTPMGSIMELTLGVSATGMPEAGGSGTSQV
jgi:hypothetical protein